MQDKDIEGNLKTCAKDRAGTILSEKYKLQNILLTYKNDAMK